MVTWTSRRRWRRHVDEDRVVEAIREAERQTTGEIRVSVSRFFVGDVRRTAERAFDRLGMRETQQRNGVLFFVVPSRRRFAVIGDTGIHAKIGDTGWKTVADAIAQRFRAGDFTAGLVRGIGLAAELLASHFPPEPGNRNELPDRVDRA